MKKITDTILEYGLECPLTRKTINMNKYDYMESADYTQMYVRTSLLGRNVDLSEVQVYKPIGRKTKSLYVEVQWAIRWLMGEVDRRFYAGLRYNSQATLARTLEIENEKYKERMEVSNEV